MLATKFRLGKDSGTAAGKRSARHREALARFRPALLDPHRAEKALARSKVLGACYGCRASSAVEPPMPPAHVPLYPPISAFPSPSSARGMAPCSPPWLEPIHSLSGAITLAAFSASPSLVLCRPLSA